MSRADYLQAQLTRTPGYDTERALARAHLDLALALAQRRAALGDSIAAVAERSGMDALRVEQIEEGDTTSLTEILRLCDALGLAITLE